MLKSFLGIVIPGTVIASLGFTTSVVAATRTFMNPRIDGGYHLDWCLTWAENCGVPAARAFYRLQGYDGVADYRKTNSARPITKTIYGGQICTTGENHPHCDGFALIQFIN